MKLKNWVAKELDSLDLQQLHNLVVKSIDDFKDEDEQYVYLSRRLAKRRLRVIADAIYNNYFLDFYNQYNKFCIKLRYLRQLVSEMGNNDSCFSR